MAMQTKISKKYSNNKQTNLNVKPLKAFVTIKVYERHVGYGCSFWKFIFYISTE